MKKHKITKEEYEAVKEAAKRNNHKRIEKRLQVIILRYEGKKDREIGEKLYYSLLKAWIKLIQISCKSRDFCLCFQPGIV